MPVERYASGRYSFAVIVYHPDEGWDHYADGFEVLGAMGERLTRRILRHPHVDEQPFTGIRGGVRLSEAVQAATVRARCCPMALSVKRSAWCCRPINHAFLS